MFNFNTKIKNLLLFFSYWIMTEGFIPSQMVLKITRDYNYGISELIKQLFIMYSFITLSVTLSNLIERIKQRTDITSITRTLKKIENRK